MTEKEEFSFSDGVICKTCKRIFGFRQSQDMIYGLTFPKRDFSSIQAKCPRCYALNHYIQEDIIRSNKDESELVKDLRGQIAQLTIEKQTLQKLFEDVIKEKITDVAKPKGEPIENLDEIKKSGSDGIYH